MHEHTLKDTHMHTQTHKQCSKRFNSLFFSNNFTHIDDYPAKPMKGSISLTIVSLCLYTCVHHKAVDSVLSLPSHIHIHTLSHIHLKHRISPRPHLSPQDAAAQSAAQVTSPECLSGGCILSCLPSWMLPSQTAFLQIAASASARNELWTPSL